VELGFAFKMKRQPKPKTKGGSVVSILRLHTDPGMTFSRFPHKKRYLCPLSYHYSNNLNISVFWQCHADLLSKSTLFLNVKHKKKSINENKVEENT
jgi:hypothetical protein